MVHINHRIGIKASVQNVYEALATTEGISGWWSVTTNGISEPGNKIAVLFHSPEGKELGSMKMSVIDLKADKKVHWRFEAGPDEWIGTEVVFELHTEDDYTIVKFSHNNWREEVPFKAHCSMKWAVFLLSLRSFVETGKGNPAPYDLKIDNWN